MQERALLAQHGKDTQQGAPNGFNLPGQGRMLGLQVYPQGFQALDTKGVPIVLALLLSEPLLNRADLSTQIFPCTEVAPPQRARTLAVNWCLRTADQAKTADCKESMQPTRNQASTRKLENLRHAMEQMDVLKFWTTKRYFTRVLE